MIRLAWMTDPARVIGATTAAGNAARQPLLPPGLPAVMAALGDAPNVLVGRRSYGPWVHRPGREVWVLSREALVLPDGARSCSFDQVLERFERTDLELVVVGGAEVLRRMLPHAERMDVAEASATVPGDLRFEDWVDAPGWRAESQVDWPGGRTLCFVRGGLMDGQRIAYRYEGGMGFEVWFDRGRVSYRSLDAGTERDGNGGIPYRSREIRRGLVHVMWHEPDLQDLVSLVFDLEAGRVHSAAMMAYRSAHPLEHFEVGGIL